MSKQKTAIWSASRALGIIILIAATFCSPASAEHSAPASENSWIKEMTSGIFSRNSQSEDGKAGQQDLEVKPASPVGSRRVNATNMLVAPSDVSEKDIILDGSNGPSAFIPGAVHISYTEFVDSNNTAYIKTAPEIAQILGDAGITENDPLVVYGECQPCGGGPSTATYVYWLLKYIGHDDVRVLNGGIDAWIESGLPAVNSSAIRPKTAYSPDLNPELYATYDYVKSGDAQIVDARSLEEFESGSIPGAINIPYDMVLDGKMVKDEVELEEIFSNLTDEKPVVVFTTTGTKASAPWFALTMIGYDAKMYTYNDWRKAERAERQQKANQSE